VTPDPTPATVERRRVAVAWSSGLNGPGLRVWLARLPALRQALDLSTGELGLLLLCISAGSVLGLPTSGPLIARFGPARVVIGAATCSAPGCCSSRPAWP
jgi:MFS family permease